ncbi:hypothetical protein K7432_003206 [Basidiobolus ranarum]|uniref:Uncharacterized protein n=1 Tax=Basidiobolus ranarum TaxID=34480 RepID=A0ABR2X0A9_9FUNG
MVENSTDSESPALSTTLSTLNSQNLYNVETLLSKRIKPEGCYYLIKWHDYPTEESTWEHESQLLHCFSLVTQLEEEIRPPNTTLFLYTFDKVDPLDNLKLEEKVIASLKKQIELNSKNTPYFQELLEKLASPDTPISTKDSVLLFCLELFEPIQEADFSYTTQSADSDKKSTTPNQNPLERSASQDDSTTASEPDDISNTESATSTHSSPLNRLPEKNTISEVSSCWEPKKPSSYTNTPTKELTKALKILARNKTKGGKITFQVYWSNGVTSWEPISKLGEFTHLVDEYEHIQFSRYDSKPRSAYNRRKVPKHKQHCNDTRKIRDTAITTFSDIDTDSDWSPTDIGISDTNFKLYPSTFTNSNTSPSLSLGKSVGTTSQFRKQSSLALAPSNQMTTSKSYIYNDNSTTDESDADQEEFCHHKTVILDNVHSKEHNTPTTSPPKPTLSSPRSHYFERPSKQRTEPPRANELRDHTHSPDTIERSLVAEKKNNRIMNLLDSYVQKAKPSRGKSQPLPGSSGFNLNQTVEPMNPQKSNHAKITKKKGKIVEQTFANAQIALCKQTPPKKSINEPTNPQAKQSAFLDRSNEAATWLEIGEVKTQPSKAEIIREDNISRTNYHEKDNLESNCCYVCGGRGINNDNPNYLNLLAEPEETLLSCNRCSFIAHKKCICSTLGAVVLKNGVCQQEVIHNYNISDSESETASEKSVVTSMVTVWCCHDCIRWPYKVEKILTYRDYPVKPRHRKDTEDDTEQPKSQTIREFLVKFKGLSYHHLAWAPSRWIRDVASARCRYFEKKNIGPQPIADVVRTQWYYIDEVLDAQLSRSIKVASPQDASKIYVKWKDLQYDESTWEDPPDSKSIFYLGYVSAFSRYIEAAKIPHYISPSFKLSSFKELHSQPPFINNGKLMKHQLDGLNWLLYKWKSRSSCILADDMGLGKTIQTISFLSVLYNVHDVRNFLVVVPNSVVSNWVKEFIKWAPNLIVTAYYGTSSNRNVVRRYKLFQKENYERAQLKCHVVITTYETMISDTDILSLVRPWEVLVVDEGHRLKNGNSRLFVKLNQLTFRHKVLLTGTPLQNDMKELFNLMSFIDPNKFFQKEKMSIEYQKLTTTRVEELHNMLKPYFLRRTKNEALKSLPTKSEVIVPVSMSPLQKELYKGILSRNHDLLKSILGVGKPVGPTRKTTLVNALMELRKCLNHPYLLDGVEEAEESEELVQERLIDASAKLSLLHLLLPKLQQRGHRVLIFSQMTRMLDILEDYLTYEGYEYCRLDGNTPGDLRQQLVDSFNEPGSNLFIFLLSTRAGGVGLNLASADTVIIYDPDFNPHADIQALSRAHRIGQEKQVLVFKFVTRGSAEERILQVGKKKIVMDHLVIEKMDHEDMNKSQVDSILKFGAKALFSEDIEPNQSTHTAIKYDDNAIESLLLRAKEVQTNQTGTDETGSSNGFGFAKIWSGDSTVLQEEDESYWMRVLKNRLAKAQVKETVQYGRGSRKRRKMKRSLEEVMSSVDEVSSSDFEENDNESSTSFEVQSLIASDNSRSKGKQKQESEKKRRRPRQASIKPSMNQSSDIVAQKALKSAPNHPKSTKLQSSAQTRTIKKDISQNTATGIASTLQQPPDLRKNIYLHLASIGAYNPSTHKLLVAPFMMSSGEIMYYAHDIGYMNMQQMLTYVQRIRHNDNNTNTSNPEIRGIPNDIQANMNASSTQPHDISTDKWVNTNAARFQSRVIPTDTRVSINTNTNKINAHNPLDRRSSQSQPATQNSTTYSSVQTYPQSYPRQTLPSTSYSAQQTLTLQKAILKRLSSEKDNYCMLCFLSNHTDLLCPFRQNLEWLNRQYFVVANINSAEVPKKTLVLNRFKHYMSLAKKPHHLPNTKSPERSPNSESSRTIESYSLPATKLNRTCTPNSSIHQQVTTLNCPNAKIDNPQKLLEIKAAINAFTFHDRNSDRGNKHSNNSHDNNAPHLSVTLRNDPSARPNGETNITPHSSKSLQTATPPICIELDSSSDETDITTDIIPQKKIKNRLTAENHSAMNSLDSKQSVVTNTEEILETQSQSVTLPLNGGLASDIDSLSSSPATTHRQVNVLFETQSSTSLACKNYAHSEVGAVLETSSPQTEGGKDPTKNTEIDLSTSISTTPILLSSHSGTPESRMRATSQSKRLSPSHISRSPKKRGTIIPIPTNRPRTGASLDAKFGKNGNF